MGYAFDFAMDYIVLLEQQSSLTPKTSGEEISLHKKDMVNKNMVISPLAYTHKKALIP